MLNFLLHPITQLSFRHCLEYPVMDLIHSLRNWNSPKGGEENVTVIAHRKKDARFQCRSWKDKGLVHFTMSGARSEGDRNERDLAFDLFLLKILGVII